MCRYPKKLDLNTYKYINISKVLEQGIFFRHRFALGLSARYKNKKGLIFKDSLQFHNSKHQRSSIWTQLREHLRTMSIIILTTFCMLYTCIHWKTLNIKIVTDIVCREVIPFLFFFTFAVQVLHSKFAHLSLVVSEHKWGSVL